MSSYTPKWIGAVFSTPGRQGSKVNLIALHWMAGTLAGTRATFRGGVRRASAHYGVEDRNVDQYVAEANTAWSLSNWPANLRSLNVEISAGPGRDATPATIETVIELVTDLCRRHGLTAAAIGKHKDYAPTQCPGTIPVEAIRAAVHRNLNPAPAAPAPPAAGPRRGVRRWNVEPGETLGQVAGYYGLPVAQIAANNGIANPDRIEVGQELVIPDGGLRVWTVDPGDTLGAIAAYYRRSVADIAAVNSITDPDRIAVGAVLQIP